MRNEQFSKQGNMSKYKVLEIDQDDLNLQEKRNQMNLFLERFIPNHRHSISLAYINNENQDNI
jgi:hypothetical protein